MSRRWDCLPLRAGDMVRCVDCGYPIRTDIDPPRCGDCTEYGPPRLPSGWDSWPSPAPQEQQR